LAPSEQRFLFRETRVDKAVNTAADLVIIDMEDTIPPPQKAETRPKVLEKLVEHRDRNITVRVNSLDSGFIEDDLNGLVTEGLRSILVPKVNSPAHIRELNGMLLAVEKDKGIAAGTIALIALMESAAAIQNVFQIVSEKTDPPRLHTVAFGAADYTLDLDIRMTREGTELLYPRSRLPVACRAAGIEPPLDTPFMIDFKDIETLKADALRARQLGFQGKLCIHPNQVEPCNTIFSPSREDIVYAEKVIRAFEEAEAKGIASLQVEGNFVDYAIVERSRRIMKLAALLERS
jgi:citrate lyase subunit beta/citryl-CoA lyase